MIVSIDKRKIIGITVGLIVITLLGVKIIGLVGDGKSISTVNPVLDNGTVNMNMGQNVSVTEGDNFFSEYRLERERVRGKELSLLKEIANNPDSALKAREAAFIKLVDLADRAEKEMQAEALVKSQGFSECAVLITPKITTVMLVGSNLGTAAQEGVIKAVSNATGCSEKAVSVVKTQNK